MTIDIVKYHKYTNDQCAHGLMIDWLFNGTSTQDGQFVPTAGSETISGG